MGYSMVLGTSCMRDSQDACYVCYVSECVQILPDKIRISSCSLTLLSKHFLLIVVRLFMILKYFIVEADIIDSLEVS